MKGLKRVFVLLLLLVVPVTFLAGCNKVKFKISFMVDGEVYDTIKTNGNETISIPENPTKDGYDFDGWYWDEDEWEKPFTANSLLDAPLSSDMKVYARFIVKHSTHTLTHIKKQSATCTANGYEEYWQCQGCNKLFSDANGYFQISSPTIIYSQGHKFGNWTETKAATYTEQGEERRDCANCDHYETRPIPKLVATVVQPTTITIDYGVINWNGSSPFGFDVIVNGESQTVNANQLEITLKSNGYNEVKVASIKEDNTKSNYVTLNGFVVNSPITNLAYVDDSTNVKFTWESSSNLYDYSFAINGTEVNIDKATHTYSVKRNTIKKGDVIEVYVKGLASKNVYPSKKVVLSLDQMDSPTLAINKLNVEWNAVNHANKYMVNATDRITGTTYSYDGANAGEYTITVTALGNNYLCNSSTLTFIKFAKPTISITNGVVSWNDIAGQYMYATLKNSNETRFEANSFELTDRTQNYEILLYAYPALNNTMQSDNILISNFVYKTYYTAYYGTQVKSKKTYSVAENSTIIYVPTGFGTKDFSNCNQDLTLIASQTLSTLSKTLIKNIIVPDYTTTLSASAFSGCSGLTSITIPNSVTSIGSGAFKYCSSLNSITLPFVGGNRSTSISIGTDNSKYLFGYIFGSTTKYFSNSPSNTESLTYQGQLYYNYSSSGCYYTMYYIPQTLRNVTITNATGISANAFYGCNYLTDITIPNSVTSITIPNSVTSIGESAFGGCNNLVYNTYQSANYLGNKDNPYLALIKAANTNIESCTIHNDTKILSNCAFENCSGLTSITIPNSVTSIGDSAFYGCSSITLVYYEGNESDWNSIEISDCNSDLTNATRYYYSETQPTSTGNCWHYDENGDIVIW